MLHIGEYSLHRAAKVIEGLHILCSSVQSPLSIKSQQGCDLQVIQTILSFVNLFVICEQGRQLGLALIDIIIQVVGNSDGPVSTGVVVCAFVTSLVILENLRHVGDAQQS